MWRRTWPEIALLAILVVACVLRGWSLGAGVPHAAAADEAAVVTRVLRILNTGDWNPHSFEHPTLVIYLHAAVALFWFLLGAVGGEWTSLAQFDVAPLYFAGRTVTAGLGVATVWLTWRIARDAAGERVGLLAAAQLAILPSHVRESQVMAMNVPLTALATAAVYLAMRIDRVGTAWAGFTAGLAAAAKYSGSLAVVAVIGTVLARPAMPLRFRASSVALAAAALAFVMGAPFVVLDLPAFLETFAAHASAVARARAESPAGLSTWLELLASAAPLWLPYAAIGLIVTSIALVGRSRRALWVPPYVFAALFLCLLAVYAAPASEGWLLPLTPVACVMAAVGVDRLAGLVADLGGRPRIVRATRTWPVRPGQPALRVVVQVVLALTVLVPFGRGVIEWHRRVGYRDTRQMTAEWLKAGLPGGSHVAVERGGPTHLTSAGFRVTEVGLLVHYPLEWYVQRKVEYLIVSSDAAWGAGYAAMGVGMVDVPALPRRPGPSIRVVRISGP